MGMPCGSGGLDAEVPTVKPPRRVAEVPTQKQLIKPQHQHQHQLQHQHQHQAFEWEYEGFVCEIIINIGINDHI